MQNSVEKLAHQPLYSRVRELLVQRLISGAWPPGHLLPSEHKIAEEIGVSQGTVRKALDEMSNQDLLVRVQGRGTYVAEAKDAAILFRYFRLTPDEQVHDPEPAFPLSKVLSIKKHLASKEEQEALKIDGRSHVWRIERLRLINNQPVLWENLSLPLTRFPSLGVAEDLPNNVYELYSQKYGVTIARVHEKIRAVAAPSGVAQQLGISSGAPLLKIDRTAMALDGQQIEWRTSLCNTQSVYYRNEL